MTEPRQIRTLATLDLNEPATVARMKLPEAEVSRLSDLGMRIGSTVRVLQASEGEPASDESFLWKVERPS